jgi:hypothetical protein
MTAAPSTDVLAHFRRLAVKRGLMPGALASADRAGFHIVLGAAACAFAAGRDYREADVNAVLKAWLATVGTMFDVDHVELRRWLVDCGLLARDGYGRRYVRADAPAPFAAVVAVLGTIDTCAEANAARAQEARRRDERKAQWLHRAAAGAPGE